MRVTIPAQGARTIRFHIVESRWQVAIALAQLIGKTDYETRKPLTVDTYNFVYGLLLLIYGVNSFAAILFHLQDPYWLSGRTVSAILTNNYLSRFPNLFRALDGLAPMAFRGFSSVSGLVQTLFQTLMGDHSMHMELPRADRYQRHLLLTKDFTIN
ncbi:MAG TPA: hypothetical protein VGH34_04360 [Vicinamibacterales bacterium]